MTPEAYRALVAKSGQVGFTRHLHQAARSMAQPITVYTLPVIDDGDITGKRGRVLVSSKEIELKFIVPDDVEVGQAVDYIEEASSMDMFWVLPNGRKFDRLTVTDKPNPRGRLKAGDARLFDVWLRVE